MGRPTIDTGTQLLLDRMKAKYWDFPSEPDEMQITQYDANDNPTEIKYYRDSKHIFTHQITYDGSGRLTIKKLIRV